ncbi:MAG: methenyltetrahydromethanopterin cyclohydrolase [Methylotenera sp.]|nr:methenyltetrahydromethanopterin cyclohydrolase [Methylotenera sp.]MSP99352.1 methenyltetrahydromethanopterin cyclohydrolase [Methylotenera sp.]
MQYADRSRIHLSVNQLSAPLRNTLLAQADILQLGIVKHASGCTIVDAGIQHAGSAEAGRIIAEICMGGLGEVHLQTDTRFEPPFSSWPYAISVSSLQPVIACLASQYAGWALSHENFFSLGSGPARALAQREDLFKTLAYQDAATSTCIVLETDKIPPMEVIEKIVRDTKIAAQHLTVILTPTTSIAGVVQIVGRVLEVALHKAHTLHFPLENIISGSGLAVLPPVAADFMTAMGRTNDAILFGGSVNLTVKGDDIAAAALASNLPSSASKDYGKTFYEVFKAVNMDFYKIDPLLFSPAKVTILNVETGRVFEAGQLNVDLLKQSFFDQ